MVGQHHRLNRHEFQQTQGNGEGQGDLVCCSPWGCKELDMTERPKNSKVKVRTRKIFANYLYPKCKVMLEEFEASCAIKVQIVKTTLSLNV